MTLLELTLVIAVMLGLTSIAFVGVGAYKEGANRAVCIHNVASVQKAVRVYSNFHQVEPGQTVEGLKDEIIASDSYVILEPACPSGGTYVYREDRVPEVGSLYCRCSIADHEPSDIVGW